MGSFVLRMKDDPDSTTTKIGPICSNSYAMPFHKVLCTRGDSLYNNSNGHFLDFPDPLMKESVTIQHVCNILTV